VYKLIHNQKSNYLALYDDKSSKALKCCGKGSTVAMPVTVAH